MKYVLLDRIVDVRAGKELTATKTFSEGDGLFDDHFPGFPVVPGTLLTEAMVQAGGWLIVCTFEFARWPLLCMIERAKFRRFVRPGELLTVRSRLVAIGDKTCQAKGEVLIDNRRVAECDAFYHAFPTDSGPDGSFEAVAFNKWSMETFESLGGQFPDHRATGHESEPPCV